MLLRKPRQLRRARLLAAVLLCGSGAAVAGGPRWVQGSGGTFTSPGVPIVWGNGGAVVYYTDLGALSSSVSNSAANALVAAAFAPWSGVKFSSASLTSGGTLNEDVSGGDVYINSSSGTPVVVWPTDVQSTYTARPLAVIYDADGSIIDMLLGNGASSPLSCNQNSVIEDVDNISSAGVIVHARLILNGRCTGSANQQSQMQYQLQRMAGRILGLDWSQANDNVFTYATAPTPTEEQYWPVMHPIDISCGPYSYQCMVNPFTLRMDDMAALGRLYPVTVANQPANPSKVIFATNTAGLTGTVSFPNGQGMTGVNVILREAWPFNSPLVVYPQVMVSSVTGYLYAGDAGNPVTGTTNTSGQTLPVYGTQTTSAVGSYSLSGYVTDYPSSDGWDYAVVSFEPINPLYVGQYSVGPYTMNQVMPAGTFSTISEAFSYVGHTNIVNLAVSDAPNDASMGAGGTWSLPQVVNSTGWWNGRFGAPKETAWYSIEVQANRTFTVEVTALDENGLVSGEKSMPVIGLWNVNEAQGVVPDWSTLAFTGTATGTTRLAVQTSTAETMRLALADERGDGRPDYNYQARVLYAASVAPAAVSISGGAVTINGMGFRQGNQVLIGGVTANVLSISDSQIVVQAPVLSALSGVGTGTAVDLEVSDANTGGSTTISGGLTYQTTAPVDAGSGPETLEAIGDNGGGGGGGQQILQSQAFSPIVLQLLSGGTPVTGAVIQVSQSVYGWLPPCTGPGRCPSPPLLSTSSSTLTTDGNGEVTVTPLQIADTAGTTTIVATAGTAATLQLTVTSSPPTQ